jgi:hypothetical protein
MAKLELAPVVREIIARRPPPRQPLWYVYLELAAALPTAEWPVKRPDNWLKLVDRPMQKSDAQAVHTSMTRDRPLGDPLWTVAADHRLRLDYTLRPRGRPKVRPKE